MDLSDLPQSLLDTYRFDGEIGRGGMAIVFRALHRELDRPAAIKLFSCRLDDTVAIGRFENEARVYAALKHPNILRLYDFDGSTKPPYMVLELAQGPTLRYLLARRKLAVDCQLLNLMASLCDGLAYAHERGVVHRDIKPANLFVVGKTIRIGDFGLATFREAASEPQSDFIVGTPAYMAPELFRAEEATPATDIYALGVVLYEVFVGSRPFLGTNARVLADQHLRKRAPSLDKRLPLVAPSLRKIIHRCLEKKPELRPSSMTEIGCLLKAVAKSYDGSYLTSECPSLLPTQPIINKAS